MVTEELLSPVVLPRSGVLAYPRGCVADPYPSPDAPERFRAWFEVEGCIVLRNAVPPRLCQAGIDAFRREVLPDRLGYFERHASGRHERHTYTAAGFMQYPIMNLQDLSVRKYAAFRRAGLNLLTQCDQIFFNSRRDIHRMDAQCVDASGQLMRERAHDIEIRSFYSRNHDPRYALVRCVHGDFERGITELLRVEMAMTIDQHERRDV